MATLTLGQMLDAALGSSRAGAIDFEQLHNLLNGMLLYLGLKDLPVQENGEPLEGAEGSPFSVSFLEELKRKVEANEKEMTQVRALCQDLHEEVGVVKAEQSRMAEDVQKIQETFDVENFKNMMDDLRNQLWDAVMRLMLFPASKEMSNMVCWDVLEDFWWAGKQKEEEEEEKEAKSSMKDTTNQDDGAWFRDVGSRHGHEGGLIVIGNEITLLERTPMPKHLDTQSVSPLSPSAKTQFFNENDMEQNVEGNGMGQKDAGWSMGRSDLGRKSMGWNMGQKSLGRIVQSRDTGRSDMGQDDTGQIKDEEIKAPSVIQKKTPDDGFTASGMHPGAPGTHLPGQRVQGHPGSQIPETVPGTSKMPSSEYPPSDQPVQLPGRRSEMIPSTPPPSPGLSGRLPRALKRQQKQEDREQVAEGYSRRSPRYCGGRHTSTYPGQPMVPLLPDPNKPGVIELVGTDGLVYRGRTALGTDSACDSSLQK